MNELETKVWRIIEPHLDRMATDLSQIDEMVGDQEIIKAISIVCGSDFGDYYQDWLEGGE